ncbi:spore gernimation protein [Paenibacillus nanensis]|uniref:Spore gernimation protein n=1 Tax=Paenibacillus nanensis TaxID=393251 RepID=A0A3A1UPL1_9BACL|nr:endospore germination permease [Paenibacillus nanensis]RIX49277.1 spore gernimation protein [Paenibacillus nanensis]
MENTDSRQITLIQASAILISTIIGVGVLPLPLFAVRAADSAAPLVTIFAIGVAFLGIALLTWLGMRFPNQSIFQYGNDIIGKWLGTIGSIVVIVFFAVLTSLTAREFGEVVVTSVLKSTPVEVTVIVMLTLAAISARRSITTFAYFHTFYFPLLLVPCVLIAILSLGNAEVINLQPILLTSPNNAFMGTFTIAALFQGSFIMTVVIPAMRKPKKAMKASLFGILVSGGLYLIIVVASVSVFGAEEIKKLLWPTLELAKGASLPANVLERLDAAFLAVWVTAVFTTLLSSYFLTSVALKQVLHLKEHQVFTFILLPIVFFMAMLPQNVTHLYVIIEDIGRVGLYITMAYPGLLLLIAMLRKKRGERNA